MHILSAWMVLAVTSLLLEKSWAVEQAAPAKVLAFKMRSLNGSEVDLSRYQGKVVLIVNTASKCGLTGQFKDLQSLHEQYADQGLAVLGFPCNQFAGQEPGSTESIRSFCQINYGVTFDMFEKVKVNGDEACDLYKVLTSVRTESVNPGRIKWNFEKFLLNRDGEVVARFGPMTKPTSKKMVERIEAELAAK